MLIVMAGLPAAGKSTIAEVVGNRMGVPVVSVDPIEAAILSAGIDADQPIDHPLGIEVFLRRIHPKHVVPERHMYHYQRHDENDQENYPRCCCAH